MATHINERFEHGNYDERLIEIYSSGRAFAAWHIHKIEA